MNKNLKFILTELQYSLSKDLVKLEITYPVYEVILNLFIDLYIDLFSAVYRPIKTKPFNYRIALNCNNNLFDIVDYVLDNSKVDYTIIFDIFIKHTKFIVKYFEKYEYYEACHNILTINKELLNILETNKIMISYKYK